MELIRSKIVKLSVSCVYKVASDSTEVSAGMGKRKDQVINILSRGACFAKVPTMLKHHTFYVLVFASAKNSTMDGRGLSFLSISFNFFQ